MGNAKSIETLAVAQPAPEGTWTVIEGLGYCDVVRHATSGQLAEQYTIPVDGRLSLLEEFQRYEFRRTQAQNLVRVLQVQKEDSKYLCSGMDFIKVRTERIPMRLSELKNVSVPETFYILQQALLGFKTVFERVGPIVITDQLVCFGGDGKVKVWLNENLAKNAPEDPLSFEQTNKKPTEQSMLTELLKAVEQHTVSQQFPPSFAQRLQVANIAKFLDAMELLREYIQHERIVVPDRIRAPKVKGDSSIAQPIQPDVNHSTVQSFQPPSLSRQQSNQESGIPILQVPTKPPEYLDQAIVRLFEQAQKTAAEENYNVQLKSAFDAMQTSKIPELVVTIAEMPAPPPEAANIATQPTYSVQVGVSDQTNVQPNQQSQRSDSKQKRNVGTPRRPPLPPSSKENLVKSTNNIEPQTVAQPANIVRPVPAVFEQRRVTTPVHVAPHQPANIVINSNRPGSSHGVQVVQLDRPGSSHGVVKTVLPTSTGGQIVFGQPHTTVVQHPGQVHSLPIATNPIHPQTVTFSHSGPIIQIRPGRIGIDTKIGPMTTQLNPIPQQFRPIQTSEGVFKQQTAIHTPTVPIQQIKPTEIKRELSVERLRGLVNRNPITSVGVQKPVSPQPYQQGPPINRYPTTINPNPSLASSNQPTVNLNTMPLSNQTITIPPPPPVPAVDSTKTFQPPPQQPNLQASSNTLGSTSTSPEIQHPQQFTAPQPATTTVFSGGIKILNNRMYAAPREPISK